MRTFVVSTHTHTHGSNDGGSEHVPNFTSFRVASFATVQALQSQRFLIANSGPEGPARIRKLIWPISSDLNSSHIVRISSNTEYGIEFRKLEIRITSPDPCKKRIKFHPINLD